MTRVAFITKDQEVRRHSLKWNLVERNGDPTSGAAQPRGVRSKRRERDVSLWRIRCYPAGAIASTRTGLPLPRTIFSGAAITSAPVGGSRSRLHKLARPNFPAPCMIV